MGCLLLLNDYERKSYWRTNIFKLENIIISESILTFIFIVLSAIIFPYNSISIVKKATDPKNLIFICSISSTIVLIITLLIKSTHIKKNIKPNYRLCIMHFLSVVNLFFIIISFIFSLCISTFIHKWANIYEFIPNKNLSKIVYIFVLNNVIILSTFFQLIDFFVESVMISKVSKFLSEGNNINNQKILLELFKINTNFEINLEEFKEKNTFDIINEKYNENKTLKKLRIIFPNNTEQNGENNTFENEVNKFREVELIEKVEYRSIGIQTEESDIKNYNKKYKNDNNLIDEDLSKNIILVKNKSLINSFNSND
jgi:hypothetical protein